jgi:hypothetical protein
MRAGRLRQKPAGEFEDANWDVICDRLCEALADNHIGCRPTDGHIPCAQKIK